MAEKSFIEQHDERMQQDPIYAWRFAASHDVRMAITTALMRSQGSEKINDPTWKGEENNKKTREFDDFHLKKSDRLVDDYLNALQATVERPNDRPAIQELEKARQALTNEYQQACTKRGIEFNKSIFLKLLKDGDPYQHGSSGVETVVRRALQAALKKARGTAK